MQSAIREVLREKPATLHAMSKNAYVYEAVRLMVQHNVGSVVVLDGRRPIGMFTERDVLARIVHGGLDPHTTFVGDVMTRPVTTASPDDTVAATLERMTETRHRHVPVVDEDGVVGLVSIGDLTKWITRAQETDIKLLAAFIHGPGIA